MPATIFGRVAIIEYRGQSSCSRMSAVQRRRVRRMQSCFLIYSLAFVNRNWGGDCRLPWYVFCACDAWSAASSSKRHWLAQHPHVMATGTKKEYGGDAALLVQLEWKVDLRQVPGKGGWSGHLALDTGVSTWRCERNNRALVKKAHGFRQLHSGLLALTLQRGLRMTILLQALNKQITHPRRFITTLAP